MLHAHALRERLNDLIVNFSHCTYSWSNVRYSFVYTIKRSVKLILVTKKDENCSSYVQVCRVTNYNHLLESQV